MVSPLYPLFKVVHKVFYYAGNFKFRDFSGFFPTLYENFLAVYNTGSLGTIKKCGL